MEDKTFNLVEKLYVEMQTGFKKVYEDMNGGFREVHAKLDQKADKTDIVRLENELHTNTSALFDGYSQLNDKFDRIEGTVNTLVEKVDNQKLEIKVVKNVRRIK